jgi:ADP-heptose:LPS heptosyltransferase
MENGWIPGVKKIAVLRALVLGDFIFSLPALEALRQAYPQAEITCITQPWAVDFVPGHARAVDRVISIRSSPHKEGDTGFLIHPEDAAWFFPQMQAEQVDLAISMQGGGIHSNPFMARMLPRFTVGLREAGALSPDRWQQYDYYQNEVSRCLDLARLAGAPSVPWEPHLPVLPTDNEEAKDYLEQIAKPFIVLHSGARDVRRMWAPEHFAALADQLRRSLGVEIVLTGSEVDQNAVLEVTRYMHETAWNLSSRLSLSSLTGLLARAQLVISNDTGVLHLALAVGTRAIGLFWGEYVSKSMPLSRTRFFPQIAWDRRCPLCGLFLDQQEVVRTDPRSCMHQVSFLGSILPEQVFQAAQTLLDQDA